MTSKMSFSQFKKQGVMDVVALANAGTTVIENVETAPLATASTPGIVQPDNTTVTINGSGVISAVGGGGGSTFINGSNNTLDFFSPDAGASVRLRQLVGGVMIDSGWEVDVQTVTPPGGADKIVAMYIDGTLLLPVVVWDDGLGGVPTIPSSALQVRNIYVDAISIQFVIVWDDGL